MVSFRVSVFLNCLWPSDLLNIVSLCFILISSVQSRIHFRGVRNSFSMAEKWERRWRGFWVPSPVDHSANSKAFIEEWIRVSEGPATISRSSGFFCLAPPRPRSNSRPCSDTCGHCLQLVGRFHRRADLFGEHP